jgi:hypothetical protein
VSLPITEDEQQLIRYRVVHPSWIRTPLTQRLLEKPGFNDHVLEPEDVASAVVKQVVSAKSAQMFMPPSFAFLGMLRSWPSWLQESLRNHVAHILEDVEL